MKYFWSFILFLAVSTLVVAQELKPYTLATITEKSVNDAKVLVTEALESQNLKVVGTYDNVHADAAVVVFTGEELMKAVGETGGLTGFAATLRVAVTGQSGKTVVSYTTPEYWGNAYFRDDFDKVRPTYEEVSQKLVAALKQLGDYKGEAFGSEKGLSEEKLRSYRYMFGMPKFDNTVTLNEFDSYSQAVAHIDAAVKKGVNGAVQVYKVEVPGKELALYGFGLNAPEGEETFMPKIDIGAHKHTAFLPYEFLVINNEVHMLHGRFRIALSFPDLTMGTFTKIMSTPGYIEDTLEKVVE